MAAPSVWTEDTLFYVFQELMREVGPYDPDKWGISKPFNYTTDTWHQFMEKIYHGICLRVDADSLPKKPASADAVRIQILTAVSLRPPHGGQMGAIPMQRRSRLAAYTAGFMTMGQIVALEGEGIPPLYNEMVEKPKKIEPPEKVVEVPVVKVRPPAAWKTYSRG